jgi:hypothetical protein
MIIDIDNLVNKPIKTTMTVDEFNRTIAYRWLTLPKDSEVRIINNHDPAEVFIEVDGKRMWRAKRKHLLTGPKKPHKKQVHVISSIDEKVRKLSPCSFKLYYWILSINERTFRTGTASKQLAIEVSTVRKSLKKIEQAGLIKIVAHTHNVGYTVEVIQ